MRYGGISIIYYEICAQHAEHCDGLQNLGNENIFYRQWGSRQIQRSY